jgi:hypothetical protein
MCRCSKRLGVVVPFVSTKGTTVTCRKEHQHMSFFAKTPKAENIVNKPRAKKSMSGRRRFIPSSTKILVPNCAHWTNRKQNFRQFNKLGGSPNCQRSTSANQMSEGGSDAFSSMSTTTKFSNVLPI